MRPVDAGMLVLDYIRCLWQGQALARTLRSLPKAAPFASDGQHPAYGVSVVVVAGF
jgi:hypothetical protein